VAVAATLSDSSIRQLAVQIAGSVKWTFGTLSPSSVELGETFELWYLDGIVNEADTQFAERVRFDHRFHHQVIADGVPAGFVVSRQAVQTGQLSALRVVPTTVAADIDRAIDRVEAAAAPNDTVCLLIAPAYQVTALWIKNDSHPLLYVVSAPPFFRELQRSTFLSPAEFIAQLAREQAGLDLDNRR
jgi:hypothetical protein